MSSEGVIYIKDYFSRYLQRVQEAESFVPREYLPKFMTSTRRLAIYDCSDGYLTLMYPGLEAIEVSAHSTTRRVADVFESQAFKGSGKRTRKRLGLDIQGGASIWIAEPEISEHSSQLSPAKVFRPHWLVAHILVGLQPSAGLSGDPGDRAEKDIRTALLARRLGVEPSPNVTETSDRTISRLEDLLDRFRTLLADESKEQQLQDFIEENSFLLAPFSQKEDFHPKYRLGKEYVTDFLIHNKPPLPFSHTFVEIEPAVESLFYKSRGRENELTTRANHAVEQLRDWRIWVRDNIAYLKNDFPNLDQCNYVLIIGRSEGLSEMQERKLAELNAEHNWRTLFTYDNLADRVGQLIARLRGV